MKTEMQDRKEHPSKKNKQEDSFKFTGSFGFGRQSRKQKFPNKNTKHLIDTCLIILLFKE
jgi:hypothetical protein